MKTKSGRVLALVLPPFVGMVGGFIVGTILYNRAVREIPAGVQTSDLDYVLFSYTALSVFAGTLLGLLIGVFLHVLLKNRNPDPSVNVYSR